MSICAGRTGREKTDGMQAAYQTCRRRPEKAVVSKRDKMANQDTLISKLEALDRRYAEAVEEMNDPAVASDPNRIIALAKDEAKKKGVKHIEATVIEGDPSERIINYAKDHDVDIIVIGSRGLGTFKGLLLGSVSNKVSHRADRTCVIVR